MSELPPRSRRAHTPPHEARRSAGAHSPARPAAPRGRRRPAHRAPRRGLSGQSRRRAFALLLAMVVAFVAIAARVAWIQGPGSAQYLAVGENEWTHTIALAATRGAILDANGDELAMSIPQTTVYADPHQVTDPGGEAQQLAAVLGLPASGLEAKLREPTGFVYLDRTIPAAPAAAVAKLDLPGIYTLQEPKRFYPAGQLAQPLLGEVGTDGTGLGGLEYKYNSVLQGRAGELVEETDPQGHQLPGGLEEYRAPVAGQDLVLTIDEPLQYDAEQALAKAIVAAGAKSGIAMLMDTKTGDILADANLVMPGPGIPSTTPAVPISIPNPAVVAGSKKAAPQAQPVEAPSASSFTQVYEPGSVNKLITISAALQEGVIVPSDVFTIPDTYVVAGTPFHDAEVHGTRHWTVTDILANSSNIGTMQIAQRLGKTDLLKYIADYGEGKMTDVGFPGETPGLLPSYWSGTSIADVPIGQGIGVTAVQMLSAYNTIANGGVYVAPRLVAGTIDAHGVERTTPIAPGHRVVSPSVAAEMTTMLDEVVRVGTGTAANLSPYTVAGKTGTALVPLDGGYEGGHYVASFAGFVPSEDPGITAMVVINDTPDYGASASAPTFATIARDALQEEKIPPHAPEPPAPGVPLATPESATGAGEVAGTPLAGLSPAADVAAAVPAASPTTASPTTASPTTGSATTATKGTVPTPASQPASPGTVPAATPPTTVPDRPRSTTTSPPAQAG